MIYKIRTKTEIPAIANKLPAVVIAEATRVAEILDDNYNSQGVDGGYILIAEDIADLAAVKKEFFDFDNEISEFTDDLGGWYSTLYLVGTEYSITLIRK